MKPLVAVMSALAVIGVACSGGGDSDSTASPTAVASTTSEPTVAPTPEPATPTPLEQALSEVSTAELAIMVLPAEELGAVVDGFRVDADSGAENANDVADATFSPTDTPADWTERGYLEGYELSYEPPDVDARFEAGTGVSSVTSWVANWSDGDAASIGMAAAVRDISASVGSEVNGVKIASFDEYAGPDLGDESIAYQAVAEFPAFEIESGVTRVLFRIGPVTAGAWLVRFGEPTSSDRADVDRLARALEARVKLVLLGEIDEPPVPVASGAVGSGTPPAGTPDLALLGLNVTDLPVGFVVDSEGYDPDPAGIAEYERDFDALGQVIGTSELIELEDTVHLFRNAGVASTFMEFMGDFMTGPSGVDAFAQGEFPIEIDEINADPIELGDEAILLTATGTSPVGDIQFAFFLVRVDSYLSMLIASGQTDRFSIDDITPLAEIVAERLGQ